MSNDVVILIVIDISLIVFGAVFLFVLIRYWRRIDDFCESRHIDRLREIDTRSVERMKEIDARAEELARQIDDKAIERIRGLLFMPNCTHAGVPRGSTCPFCGRTA